MYLKDLFESCCIYLKGVTFAEKFAKSMRLKNLLVRRNIFYYRNCFLIVKYRYASFVNYSIIYQSANGLLW